MRAPGIRRRLVLATAATVAITLAVITVAFNLVLGARLSSDATNVVHSRAEAALATLAVDHGRVAVEETPGDAVLDARVWVFQGRRAVERAPGNQDVQAAAVALGGASKPTTHDVGRDARLEALPFEVGGRRLATVVASVSLVPYEHTRNLALIASLVLDGVILLFGVLLARSVVHVALRPVAEMTARAADWSEHDLDRRFALGPPRDELTSLAATLDALLGRLGASLRHEQRFSSEIAHELRTPLSRLRAEAELALRHERPPGELRDALGAVLTQTDRMASVVETLVAAAEREADPHRGTVDAQEAAAAAVESCATAAAEHGLALTVRDSGGDPIEVDVDADLTTQILVALVDNAIRYGRSSAAVEVTHEAGSAVFAVVDDGPGVEPDETERVFEPGVRGSAAGETRGAGLGLALARRLARSAGGDVVARANSAGGRFEIRLPAS
jgi:signal transduction histidine kinase